MLCGMPSLAPLAHTAMILAKENIGDSSHQVKAVRVFKAMELYFEAMPQAVLQVYVGVAYGKLDLSSDMDYLLAVSVFISLLGAGVTAAGFETMKREHMAVTSHSCTFLCRLSVNPSGEVSFGLFGRHLNK
mgnify:CR=1 FL=1